MITWSQEGQSPSPQARFQLFLKGLRETPTKEREYVLWSDEQGRYEFRHVVAGSYQLTDVIAGRPKWRLKVVLEPGKDVVWVEPPLRLHALYSLDAPSDTQPLAEFFGKPPAAFDDRVSRPRAVEDDLADQDPNSAVPDDPGPSREHDHAIALPIMRRSNGNGQAVVTPFLHGHSTSVAHDSELISATLAGR